MVFIHFKESDINSRFKKNELVHFYPFLIGTHLIRFILHIIILVLNIYAVNETSIILLSKVTCLHVSKQLNGWYCVWKFNLFIF